MALFTPTKVLRSYYTTPKISTECAQTLPYGSTPLSTLNDYLHSAKPLVCEVNQSAFRRL
jgi:hypothetical protein